MRRILLLIFCLLPAMTFAQGVAINNSGAVADTSAMLDVSSTTKGMLIPRMTEVERNQIQNPAEGLLIYNTTTGCINMYTAGIWKVSCFDCDINPPVLSNNGPLCVGDDLQLSATSISGATYSWTGPSGFSSSLQNILIPNVTSSNSGLYTCVASVSGCVLNAVSTNVNINTLPLSTFTYAPSTPTLGQTVVFSPNQSGATYSWTFLGGTPATSTAFNPSVTWSTGGTYDVILNVTDNGCSSTDTVQLSVINCPPGSTTFTYTGSVQTFTVPACVSSIQVELWGAEGTDNSSSNAGLGAYVKGTLAVTPGSTIYVYVGGQSGWNGGGTGGSGASTTRNGKNGGGASDLRIGGQSYNDRVAVAGGGGGAGRGDCSTQHGGGGGFPGGLGGTGGGTLDGGDGSTNGGDVFGGGGGSTCTSSSRGGAGGGQNGGGAAGGYGNATGGSNGNCGQANPDPFGGGSGTPNTGGCFGVGGDGGSYSNGGGGGGGGGWYGGGAGGGNWASGGGGGSSYLGSMTSTSFQNAVRNGNGQVIISW